MLAYCGYGNIGHIDKTFEEGSLQLALVVGIIVEVRNALEYKRRSSELEIHSSLGLVVLYYVLSEQVMYLI